ncbi:MAG TPA: response regulator transcription factor [Blastocatellia bacterium]|nr:response regulator transcription factor [Blastocatellia bacterium]
MVTMNKDEGALIHVVIADDHPVFRQGLRQAIESDRQIQVIGEAGDGEAAIELLRALSPDVVVLDIGMPKINGFAVARQMRESHMRSKAIFLTMYDEEDAFNRAIDLGVKGYILKDSAVTDIVAGIKAVAAGEHYLSPALSSYLVNRANKASRLRKQQTGLDLLTEAERRILKLIAEQKTSKQIAGELFISPRTVDNHRANICEKLQIHGSNALLKFALEHKSEF